ncbi:MAG: hypothetical protein GX271_08905 [Clostridiales bacterium]|nr:hypothetical protein [Clostridiales bacterium]
MMYVYHVVTDRPMQVGQQIVFDETHHSGVYRRVFDKIDIVNVDGQITVVEIVKEINANVE